MKKLVVGSVFLGLFASASTFAYDQIYRPFLSARSAGMGSTRIADGQYEDNFFGNPALVVDNPHWKISLLDLTLEVNSGAIGNVSKIVSASHNNGEMLRQIAETSGHNNHLRLQTAMPAIYVPPSENGKWAFAIGFLFQTQLDLGLRRNYQVDPQSVTDGGPAFTVGRKFGKEDALALGATTHVTYRLSSKQNYDTTNLLQGQSLSPSETGGEGAHVDVDLGARYKFQHAHPLGLDLSAGVAINNLLGGRYSNLHPDFVHASDRPRQQPRAFGAGVAARREKLGPFRDFVASFEITDIGNNANGSIYRLLHMGAETKFAILAPRFGINQGYICAGLGIDLKLLTLDFATYGEEMSLNTGGLQDRRYTVKLAFQI